MDDYTDTDELTKYLDDLAQRIDDAAHRIIGVKADVEHNRELLTIMSALVKEQAADSSRRLDRLTLAVTVLVATGAIIAFFVFLA